MEVFVIVNQDFSVEGELITAGTVGWYVITELDEIAFYPDASDYVHELPRNRLDCLTVITEEQYAQQATMPYDQYREEHE